MSPARIQDWVIDVDTHVTEPANLWSSRLAARGAERAPRMVRNPESGVDTWRIGDAQTFLPVGFTAVAVLGALAIVNLVALIPGRSAARTRPAVALRSG